jgi:hypothetical protein
MFFGMKNKQKLENRAKNFFGHETNAFPYFYLSHMEYEGSIGLLSRKMEEKIAEFHILGLFYS